MATRRSWVPERVLTTAEMALRIDARCPGLAPATIAPLAEGFDNSVVLVNGRWVFRFPRREAGAQLVRTEIALLAALAGRLPLPVPHPRHAGEPDENYPWPWFGYERLPGETADRVAPDEAARAAAALPLARFLRALHDVPVGEARALGVAGDGIRRLDIPYRSRSLRQFVGQCVEAGLLADAAPCEAVIAAAPPGFKPAERALVHGDLHARNLLLDASGAPTGVIDWGDVHIGDPAIDLALAWSFLPPAGRPAFRAAYGEIGPERWAAARFKALYTAVILLQYAHELNDAPLVDECRRAIGWITAER